MRIEVKLGETYEAVDCIGTKRSWKLKRFDEVKDGVIITATSGSLQYAGFTENIDAWCKEHKIRKL